MAKVGGQSGGNYVKSDKAGAERALSDAHKTEKQILCEVTAQ